MDSLPTEIVQQILDHLPKKFLPSCRLVCRTFAALTFPLLFSHIPKWLDYEASHRAVISLAHDAYNRPAVMWSPWATGPDGPVEEIFLKIIWKLLMKTNPPGFEELEMNDPGEGKRSVRLTATNFVELSEREEMTENQLRTGQNRYLLHRSYTENHDSEFRWEAARSDLGFEM
jgi:hypothetical protein